MKKPLTSSEMGKRSIESRKQRFSLKDKKDVSKMMSHIRKGKKLSTFKA